MRKLSLLVSLLAGLFFTTHVKAQSNAEFFAGKWKMTVMGTPNGDGVMTFVFENKDGKLSGFLTDSTGKEVTKIDKIEESGKTITAYFNTQGYDINLTFEPLDADNVKGSLMNMFDAKGVRVKEGSK